MMIAETVIGWIVKAVCAVMIGSFLLNLTLKEKA